MLGYRVNTAQRRFGKEFAFIGVNLRASAVEHAAQPVGKEFALSA
jgi:hypothetical protein